MPRTPKILLLNPSTGTWAPAIGGLYRVEGHYLGDFIAEILRVDADVARVSVVDPLRPLPKVRQRCPFPGCVRKDWHDGDHELAAVRPGGVVELFWKTARWIRLAA